MLLIKLIKATFHTVAFGEGIGRSLKWLIGNTCVYNGFLTGERSPVGLDNVVPPAQLS